MKYLKLLPLLIAAAFVVPRAHAATAHAAAETDSRSVNPGMLLAVLGVICLARTGKKNERFKAQSEL